MSVNIIKKIYVPIRLFHMHFGTCTVVWSNYDLFVFVSFNYQVSANKCWSCGKICVSIEDMQKHLHVAVNFDGNSFPWDDDRYLNPFLQDDSLLYSFGEDDEDEENDTMSIDTKELTSYLSQFEHLDIHDEGACNGCTSELQFPSENGGEGVELSFDKDMGTANASGNPIVNETSNVEYGSLYYGNRKKEMHNANPLKIAANDIKNIDKNYFGSYSSFGIHRDMISDKV